MIRRIAAIGILLVLALLSAGCVTTPWEGDFSPGGERSDARYARTPESYSLYQGGSGSPAPVPASDSFPDLSADQKIVKTSRIQLEVENVTAALDPLRSIAASRGGYLGSLSVSSVYGDRLHAVATIRVPSREFEPTIAEIKGLGSLKSESLSADDVTEEYVDLEARRSALAGQLAQYTRIMEKAVNVSEILEVQVQIERVQVELDRIDGRLRYLDNRVDYATITVTLQESEPVGGREGFSFIPVINEGISGFLAVTSGLVIILISIIPLVIIGVVAYLLYWWWKGRRAISRKVPEEKKNEGKPPGQ
jgi:hypothetical protein